MSLKQIVNDPKEKQAHLREFSNRKQCELKFSLNTEMDGGIKINEEISSVRQATDTVGSLLQHTVNIIKKMSTPLSTTGFNEENAPNIPIALKIDQKNVKNRRTLHSLVEAKPADVMFEICGHTYRVLFNTPIVEILELPAIIFSNSIIKPKCYAHFTKQSMNAFTWYKSIDKDMWEKIGEKYSCHIKDYDGCYVKLICVPCSEDGKEGPLREVVSENQIVHMGELPICPFENRHTFTTNKLEGNEFRIISYNTLSFRYSYTQDKVPYCSLKALSIDYRKHLISKELLGYNADLIFLQEIDVSIYSNYFKDIFHENGYKSWFHKKGNRISEGLACIFNVHRFKLIKCQQIIFCDEIKSNRLFSYAWGLIKGNKEVSDYFLRQATSLQYAILKDGYTNKILIIGNTHLFYHPDAAHIRLLQINMCTTFLNSLRVNYAKKGLQVYVIMCGDFNCSPSSSVYSYMVNGKLEQTNEIFEKFGKSAELYHRFNFTSACGTPKYTNYTEDFKDCLDYIFIEKHKFDVVQVVPFPSEEELSMYVGLPNEVYPSDHLALVVDLKFKL